MFNLNNCGLGLSKALSEFEDMSVEVGRSYPFFVNGTFDVLSQDRYTSR